MYTDDEEKKQFPIRAVLVKMVIIIIFIMLLMWLLPISLFNNNKKIMEENTNKMKDAALSYYTDEKLPPKNDEESKITLKKMLELKLLDELKDKSGKTCDSESSNVILKKQDDNYLMTIYLKCGKDEKTTQINLNKYDYCETTLCEKDDDKNKGNVPTCSLVVSKGELGVNDWYRSDVTVKFESKKASNNAKITEYGLDTKKNYNNKDNYKVTKDGTIKIYGYVKDSKGKESTCSITINKDTKKPTCKLSVLNGSMNSTNDYISDVEVGFETKKDDLSGIDVYGISNTKEELYNSDEKVTITKKGSTTLYGYVKDKAGNTNSCQITVNKITNNNSNTSTTGVTNKKSNKNSNNNSNNNLLSCKLEVYSGTLGKNNTYTTDVKIKFKNITTSGSKVIGYGIGKSKTYAKNSSYTIKDNGTHTIYGYVKDSKGNTSKCSIQIKRSALIYNYEYIKTIPAKYSAWSSWKEVNYNPSNPPKFEKTDTKQVENLGKKTTVSYKYSVGKAIYLNQLNEINRLTEQVCKGYDYYRLSSTTYALKKNQSWIYQGTVKLNTTPNETIDTKYVFDRLDWNCGKCSSPNIIWKKYTRSVLTVVNKNTLKQSNGSTIRCDSLTNGHLTNMNRYKQIVAFNQTRKEVNNTSYIYRYRSRQLLQKSYTDYKYSTSKKDTSLLNKGYKLTGKVTVK